MSQPRSVLRLGLLASLCAIQLTFSSRPAEAAKLKVILATDNKASDVGADMKVNSGTMFRTLYHNLAEDAYELREVDVKKFTAAEILAEIGRLKVERDDAVLFYYSGHGAYDPERKTYLMASGDEGKVPLFLSQITDAIEAKKPRSVTVIADCCNTLRPVNGGIGVPAPGQYPDPIPTSPLFDKLFFKSRGTVVIRSSAPGEYALVEPQIQAGNPGSKEVMKQNQGSLFTNCLSRLLDSPFNQSQRDWTEICQFVQLGVDARFNQLCPEGRVTLGTGQSFAQARQNITAWIDGVPVKVRKN